jgi:hypothetical protein
MVSLATLFNSSKSWSVPRDSLKVGLRVTTVAKDERFNVCIPEKCDIEIVHIEIVHIEKTVARRTRDTSSERHVYRTQTIACGGRATLLSNRATAIRKGCACLARAKKF